MRKTSAAVLCALVAAAVATSSALAGEITGNGKSLQIAPHTLHGTSLCAFSGLNDGYIAGKEDVRTQSFGTDFGRTKEPFPPFLHPGQACNPNIGLDES